MKNPKMLFLFVGITVSCIVNALNPENYWTQAGNPKCDSQKNTLLHKFAQTCHKPGEFVFEIRPTALAENNFPQELAELFVLIKLLRNNTPKKHLSQALNSELMRIGEYATEKVRNDEGGLDFDSFIKAKNNENKTALDIFREQSAANPGACDWCDFFKNALELYEEETDQALQEEKSIVEAVMLYGGR